MCAFCVLPSTNFCPSQPVEKGKRETVGWVMVFSQRIGSLGIFQDRGACDDLHAGSAQCDALRGTGAASTQGPNMTQRFSQDSFSATAIFPICEEDMRFVKDSVRKGSDSLGNLRLYTTPSGMIPE